MKLIPLEEVEKLVNEINLVVYGYKMEELKNGIKALPTIDPLAEIDKMIEEKEKVLKCRKSLDMYDEYTEELNTSKSTLHELKSRLSPNL